MIRLLAIAALATFMLMTGSGLQGCLENPGPDSRVNQPDTAFQHIGSARLHGEKVLDYSARIDGNYIGFRVKNVSGRTLSSAKVLVQVLPGYPDADTSVFVSNAQLEFMEDFREIRPGSTVLASQYEGEFGKAFASGVQDFGFFITLLELNDGSVRQHSMSGFYEGNYSAMDSTRYRYSGTVRGFIDANGQPGFILKESEVRGINGYLSGSLGGNQLASGNIRYYTHSPGNGQRFDSALFFVDTLGNLDAVIHPYGASAPALDSLKLRMVKPWWLGPL